MDDDIFINIDFEAQGLALQAAETERDELQRRLNEASGQASLLRSRVDRTEREKRDLQARLDAAAGVGGAAAQAATTQGPTAAELARQLEALRQQLAFRDAEAAEERRRSAERDARLAEAQAAAEALAAERANATALRQGSANVARPGGLSSRVTLLGWCGPSAVAPALVNPNFAEGGGSGGAWKSSEAALSRALAWEDGEPAAGRGTGVLRLLLQQLLTQGVSDGLGAAALRALTALVAASRANRGRAAMAPVLTSGALERGAAPMDGVEPGGAREGLRAERGEGSRAGRGKGPLVPGDAVRWRGAWQLLAALLACLAPPPPQLPPARSLLPAASPGASPSRLAIARPPHAGASAERGAASALPSGWGPYKMQRRAMAAVAALLEAQRHGLLLALLSDEAGACATASPVGAAASSSSGHSGGALAQRLVTLADAVTKADGGGVLAVMRVPQLPSDGRGAGAAAAAAAWVERLRLAQEALTLLRGLAADAHTAAAMHEDLAASPAALRTCLVALSRLAQWQPPLPALLACVPLRALRAWAPAIGSSSTARSINPSPGPRADG
ncbi:hypothetical protein WJX81_007653 [Elliptochloris bilobata]|uniref:Uncharacterized protein n=1 Tax=Elliptochloris bilobata TaxID=381761 RepID=A0AAW1S3J7_9CHLO